MTDVAFPAAKVAPLEADDLPWDAHQVARALGKKSAQWFRRRRAELERRYGFPPPLPGCGNAWHPPAVRAWKASRYAALFDAEAS